MEFSARTRHEHELRGYEWYDLIKHDSSLEEKDFIWAKYPSDKDILEVGVRGIYIGNYFKWEPNKHSELIKKSYGWREAEVPFERTYRRMSNLGLTFFYMFFQKALLLLSIHMIFLLTQSVYLAPI